MTKTLITTGLIAAFGFAALAPNSASAADGTINFSDQVVAQTCLINGAASGGNTTLPTVTLPWVLAPAMSAAGTVAGNTPFTISVTKCDPALKKVQAQFSGTNINSATNNLKVATGTGNATNVELQLLNADSSAILLGQATAAAQNSEVVNLDATGNATMNYSVQYKSLGSTTAGTVTSSTQFTMIYQ